jgi:hypothetical protein
MGPLGHPKIFINLVRLASTHLRSQFLLTCCRPRINLDHERAGKLWVSVSNVTRRNLMRVFSISRLVDYGGIYSYWWVQRQTYCDVLLTNPSESSGIRFQQAPHSGHDH